MPALTWAEIYLLLFYFLSLFNLSRLSYRKYTQTSRGKLYEKSLIPEQILYIYFYSVLKIHINYQANKQPLSGGTNHNEAKPDLSFERSSLLCLNVNSFHPVSGISHDENRLGRLRNIPTACHLFLSFRLSRWTILCKACRVQTFFMGYWIWRRFLCLVLNRYLFYFQQWCVTFRQCHDFPSFCT